MAKLADALGMVVSAYVQGASILLIPHPSGATLPSKLVDEWARRMGCTWQASHPPSGAWVRVLPKWMEDKADA